MSIREPFVTLILSGIKKVELRRVPMKRGITHVLIYESRGAGQVVGYFEVSKIVEARPSSIWRRFGKVSGLDKSEFDRYYFGCVVAVAIGVKKAVRLKEPFPLSDFQIQRPPQSFMYICNSNFRRLCDV